MSGMSRKVNRARFTTPTPSEVALRAQGEADLKMVQGLRSSVSEFRDMLLKPVEVIKDAVGGIMSADQAVNLSRLNPVSIATDIATSAALAATETAKESGAADIAAEEVAKAQAVVAKDVAGDRATSRTFETNLTKIAAKEDVDFAKIKDSEAGARRGVLDKTIGGVASGAISSLVKKTGTEFTATEDMKGADGSTISEGDVYKVGPFGGAYLVAKGGVNQPGGGGEATIEVTPKVEVKEVGKTSGGFQLGQDIFSSNLGRRTL
jgi:hypothetical protein